MALSSIKIDLDRRPGLHGFLVNRGAPRHLLRSSFELTTQDLSIARHDGYRAVTPAMQLSYLKKSIAHPMHGSWWMVIGSDVEDKTTSACALAVMQSAVVRNLHEPHVGGRPFFWNLYGGRWDRLRDDENFRTNLGRVGMLILSNVAANSTPEKLEKARDLLVMYSNIPRVLLVSGKDPFDFAVSLLYMKPSRVVYVKPRGRIRQL